MNNSERECIISIKTEKDKEQEDNELNSNNNNNNNDSSPVNMSIDDKQDTVTSANTSSSLNHIPNPFELYRKLEIVKEIKSKTTKFQILKSNLTSQIDLIENSDKLIGEFKSELDSLYQERVNLLDELRQIETDIATVEKTIKQSEEEKRRALESAKRVKIEYRPLKEQLNVLMESVGLNNQPDEQEDEILIENFLAKLGSDDTPTTTPPKYSLGIDRLLNDKPKIDVIKQQHQTEEPISAFSTAIKSSQTMINHPFFLSQMDLPVQLATAALMAHTLRNNRPPSPTQIQHVLPSQSVQFNPFQSQPQQHQQNLNQFILNQINSNQNITSSSTPTSSIDLSQTDAQIQLQPPQFRQQPPPMKACLSCNQQIHRNAPICPLCKAKSRSRNPKKPKKSTKSNSPDSLSPDRKHTSVKRSLDNL